MMTDKAKQIIDSIKQACDVFAAMELPMAERECTLSYDAAMTLVKEMETIQRERDAAVADVAKLKRCEHCIGYEEFLKIDGNIERCNACEERSHWQWRGVNEE